MEECKSLPTKDSQAERVWNLLTGVYDLPVYSPPEALTVRNEWNDNPECANLWQQIAGIREQMERQPETDGFRHDLDFRVLSNCYERLMKLSGLKMFEYGQILPRQEAEHTVGAYADRQRKEQEERIAEAAAKLCEQYGIEPDSPYLQALTDAYRSAIDFAEAAAYAKGAAWGINEKSPAVPR